MSDSEIAQKFAALPQLPAGQWVVYNNGFPNKVIDLADYKPNGHIQGHKPNGSTAQKWTTTWQDAQGKTVTFENTPNKSYVTNLSPNVAGRGLVGNFPGSVTYQLTMISPTVAKISVPGSDLYWALTSGDDGTQIVLQYANDNNPQQQWSFVPA